MIEFGCEKCGRVLRLRGRVGSECGIVFPDDTATIIEAAWASQAAARRTLRAEGERKDRPEKKTG
jgi:hypothetical protein